ncbi:hypothetical protein D3C78_911550 [compost metagenome]
MRAEVDRLRKDARRLDWVLDSGATLAGAAGVWWLVFEDGSHQDGEYETEREAIDAAMEESQ